MMDELLKGQIAAVRDLHAAKDAASGKPYCAECDVALAGLNVTTDAIDVDAVARMLVEIERLRAAGRTLVDAVRGVYERPDSDVLAAANAFDRILGES